MAAKKAKGHVPMDILEKRYQRLGRIIKQRGGSTGSSTTGPTPKEWTEARKPPKKKK